MRFTKSNIDRRRLLKLAGTAASSYLLVSCSDDDETISESTERDHPYWEPANLEEYMDDELQAFYQLLPDPLLDFENVPIQALRFGLNSTPSAQGLIIEDVEIPSSYDGQPVILRIYRPAQLEENAPAIYSIHGGGMVIGSISMDDARNIHLANSLNALVVAPEYRLAPEYPYPVPLEDCYVGLTWLSDSASELGIDSSRIAISGQSAGAGLAAGLSLLARDQGGPKICFQHLIYPMIDDSNTSQSSFTNADSKVWSRQSNLFGWSAYLEGRDGSDDIPYYAAPSRATDLTNLPPAFIAVGSLDIFMDEDIEYARALTRAGIATELHVYPGAFHGFDTMLPNASLSQRWSEVEMAALRKGIAK